MSNIKLYNGDCLGIMKDISDNSIDLILCDLPYSVQNSCYGEFKQIETEQTDKKFPLSVLDFEREHPQKYHPTQKPVALLEYLIKTYSFIGDTVLDNCMGSGSTGVACKNTDRDFIGIEIEKKYFDIANDRINKVSLSKKQIIAEIEGQLKLI